MKEKTDQKGFTLIEILVALGIMALGFLAVSQMQFLSLRQAGLAETGTTATNIIDLAANRDLQELRRLHLLNYRAYIEAVNGEDVSMLPYCTGANAICTDCPCDPLLEVFDIVLPSATDQGEGFAFPPTVDLNAQSCAAIELNNFDPAQINYFDAPPSAGSPLPDGCLGTEFVLLRFVESFRVNGANPTESDSFILRITYGIKTGRELARNERGGVNLANVSLGSTTASQTFTINGFIETDWDRFVNGWDPVFIPNVP